MTDNQSLHSYVDRLINLEREKKQISDIISELKHEAQSGGLDSGAITDVVARIMADDSKVAKKKAREEAARMYAESIGQAELF